MTRTLSEDGLTIYFGSDDGPSFHSPAHCRLCLPSDHAGTNDIYVATYGT